MGFGSRGLGVWGGLEFLKGLGFSGFRGLGV